MFGWFKPECPVDPETKEWIETRMGWLAEEFGPERLLDVTVIEPTPEFFPDPYDGSRHDARKLLTRVCRYMDVEPGRITLKFYVEKRPTWDGTHRFTAGQYSEGVIRIEEASLQDPMALVGTMAHELGHVHLLGDGRISPEVEDHEPLTDLLTVYLGTGIFLANSSVRESYWHAGQVSGWQHSRLGYLSMDMFGYAFALSAWFRGEEKPRWADHLRGDVHAAFKKGLRYVKSTGDSLFKPLHLR
jgi:hypothetical protein